MKRILSIKTLYCLGGCLIMNQNAIFKKLNPIIHKFLILIIFIFALLLNCSEAEKPEPTWPIVVACAIAWSPDGSTIASMWVPLYWDEFYQRYDGKDDSAGVWFINPDGSDLRLFRKSIHSTFDWHPDGSKILVPGGIINIADTSLTQFPWIFGGPRYNSDGSKILSVTTTPIDTAGLWIVNSDGSNLKLIKKAVYDADWAPNDTEIVFVSAIHASCLLIIDTTGTTIDSLSLPETYAPASINSPPAFSPDGNKILFEYRTDSLLSDWQICVIKRDGTGFTQVTEDGGRYPVWSPDGSKIAYCKHSFWGSEEEGDGQLWVMNADGTNKRQLTFVVK
ncbi:PD40 domain-containing protein [candidate division WOR-3 bacterium]|nr:PD40 domain-containing protein [candidate division WOR-3 bacterium]